MKSKKARRSDNLELKEIKEKERKKKRMEQAKESNTAMEEDKAEMP